MIAVATLGLAITYLAAPVDWVRATILVVGASLQRSPCCSSRGATVPQTPCRAGCWPPASRWSPAARPSRSLGQPSPSYADIPRLLAYPALAGAVIAFQRDRIRHDRASLLDALVVTVAAAQAGWLALIEPVLRDDTATLGQLTVAGAYPLGDLLVLGVLARLGFAVIGSRDARRPPGDRRPRHSASAPRSPPSSPTGPSLTVGLVARRRADRAGRPCTPRWPTRRACCRHRRWSRAWRFVVLLGLACLVSPVLVLTHSVGDDVTDATVVLGGAVVLFTLALLRIVSLLGHLRRALRREHVLRGATAAAGQCRRPRRRTRRRPRAAVDLLDQPGTRAKGFSLREFASYVCGSTTCRACRSRPTTRRSPRACPATTSGSSACRASFGWLEIQFPEGSTSALGGLSILVVGIALVGLWRERAGSSCGSSRSWRWSCLRCWPACTGPSTARWWAARAFNQGRYLLPLVAVAGVALAQAIRTLPRRLGSVALGAALGGLVVLDLFSLGLTLTRFYA